MNEPFRSALSAFYLSLAESMPGFGFRWMNSLRSVREHQLEQAWTDLERALPAPGTSLRINNFLLFEVFLSEDVERIEAVVRALFPAVDTARATGGGNFFTHLRRVSSQLGCGTRWHRLGSVCRRDQFWGTCRIVPDLPEEIEVIDVALHKISSSVFVFIFDVRLTTAASLRLHEEWGSCHLPRMVFHGWAPWSVDRGCTSYPAHLIRRQSVTRLLDELRSRVEGLIWEWSGRRKGYFASNSVRKGPSLPACEIYTIDGVPTLDQEQFSAWRKNTAQWADSFGFALRAFHAYRADHILFMWPDHDQERGDTPYRIVMFVPHEKLSDSIKRLEDDLEALIEVLTFSEVLVHIQHALSHLRHECLTAVERHGRFRLGPYVRLNDQLLKEGILLRRVVSEFEEEKKYLEGGMMNFTAFVPEGGPPNTTNLREVLVNNVVGRGQRLTAELERLSTWFSNLLQARNVAATYWLRISAFCWTMGVFILSRQWIYDNLIKPLINITLWLIATIL